MDFFSLKMFQLVILYLAVSISGSMAKSIHIPRFHRMSDLASRVDAHTSADYLLMPHIYRAFILPGSSPEVLRNGTVSKACEQSLHHYYRGLQAKQVWAWKMYDATGKQSAGVFVGATTWTGNYEECFNAHKYTLEAAATEDSLAPQFCSIHMTHAPWMPELISEFERLNVSSEGKFYMFFRQV